jgi:3-methyladenine DNA glycosylase AlkD
LWDRRIAVISSFFHIRAKKPQIPIAIIKKNLQDKHDLIQKANGWMLREIGNNCGKKELTSFLDKYKDKMPRTTLRYAIEKLTPAEKQFYMAKPAKLPD